MVGIIEAIYSLILTPVFSIFKTLFIDTTEKEMLLPALTANKSQEKR